MQGVGRGGRAERPALAIDESDAHTESSKVDAGHDTHRKLPVKRFSARPQEYTTGLAWEPCVCGEPGVDAGIIFWRLGASS